MERTLGIAADNAKLIDGALRITGVTSFPQGWVFHYDAYGEVLLGNVPYFVAITGEMLPISALCAVELFVKNWQMNYESGRLVIALNSAEEKVITRIVTTILVRSIQLQTLELRLEPVDCSTFNLIW